MPFVPRFQFLVILALVALGCPFAGPMHAQDAPAGAPPVVTPDNTVQLLLSPEFDPLPDGNAGPWLTFEGGFTGAPGQGPKGKNAVTMTRQEADPARGIRQIVVLNQTKPGVLQVAGWSRAENVSGTADASYALYCDILYADGTNLWGQNVPFKTGTHDWERAEFSITPEKPVQSLTFYALFREHTGQVWFSDLSLRATADALPPKAGGAPMPPQAPGATESDQLKVLPIKPAPALPYQQTIPTAGAALKVVAPVVTNVLSNPLFANAVNGVPTGWAKWGTGFTLEPGEAKAQQPTNTVVRVSRRDGDAEQGIMQEVLLNQQTPQTLYFSGWSKAENVSGTADSDYSLYADLTFADGSNAWGQNAPFRTGTATWQRAELVISASKPIKSLRIYALFRNHTGTAWFRDLSLGPLQIQPGTAEFDGLSVRVPAASQAPISPANSPAPTTTGAKAQKTSTSPLNTYATRDGLRLLVEPKSGRVLSLQVDGREHAAPGVMSGFLARDVANHSDFLPLAPGKSQALQLQLQSQVQATPNHIEFSGRVSDLTGRDRAISLVFALPLDARGWTWANDMRTTRTIGKAEEISNTVGIGSGANGRLSLYPLAEVHDARAALGGQGVGLSLCLDPTLAAQYRLAVNSATRQFYIVFDFGLTPEKSSADFRFVLFRTDARWGFRSALEKVYALFPAAFEAHGAARQQGIWMPFNDLRPIPHWQDFGFRFREAGPEAATNGSATYDRANGVLSLRYSEPSTWWMNMTPETPRTYEAALGQLERTANNEAQPQYREARAVISSGFRDESGQLCVLFRNAPWASGAVWSLSPSPHLPGEITEAKIKAPIFQGTQDAFSGEYLDSLEGYVTADLDFDREHFRAAQAPLTFATTTHQPAQQKGLLLWEFTRWEARQVHGAGGLMMANSVPSRFGFLMPWLDVAGTETDWNSDGNYRPDDDSVMNLRRAWSGRKPYLLLQNTDFRRFDATLMRRYMERSLFYGMFPSCFSADAATAPYWQNPALYERDRPLFRKYVPLVKAVSEAGWQPVTLATCQDADVWLERWGNVQKGPLFLTVRNNAGAARTINLKLDAEMRQKLPPESATSDLISGAKFTVKAGLLTAKLQPDQTMLLQFRS